MREVQILVIAPGSPRHLESMQSLRTSSSIPALAGLALLLLLARPARAVTGGEPPAEGDRRYDAIGAFSLAAWLLDAGGVKEHNWFCTAVLIAPDKIVTAAHCVSDPVTAGKYVVRFRRKPDGSLGSVAAGGGSFHHVTITSWQTSTHDLALGTLAQPVAHITPIPVLTSGVPQLEALAPVTHGGWGREGPGFDAGPRRQLLLCDSVIDRGTPTAFATPYLAPGTGCAVNKADSGSPLLLEDARTGELRTIASASSVFTSMSPTGEIIGGTTGWTSLLADPALGLVDVPFASPDLVIGLEAPRRVIVPGEQLAIPIRSTNVGGVATAPGLPVRVTTRLSVDEVWGNGDDIVLPGVAASTLAAGASQDLAITFAAAVDVPFGAYRIATRIDEEDAHAEAVSHNNTAWSEGFGVWLSPAHVEYRRILLGELADAGGEALGSIAVYERTNGSAAVLGWGGELGFFALDVPLGPAGELEVTATDGVSILRGAIGAGGLAATIVGRDITATAAVAPAFGASAGPAGLYYGTVEGSLEGGAEIALVIAPSGEMRIYGEAGPLRATFASTHALTRTTARLGATAPGSAFSGDLAWSEELASFRIDGEIYQLPDRHVTFTLVRERTPEVPGQACTSDAECAIACDLATGLCTGAPPTEAPAGDHGGCSVRTGAGSGGLATLALLVVALLRRRRPAAR